MAQVTAEKVALENQLEQVGLSAHFAPVQGTHVRVTATSARVGMPCGVQTCLCAFESCIRPLRPRQVQGGWRTA